MQVLLIKEQSLVKVWQNGSELALQLLRKMGSTLNISVSSGIATCD